ncbi:hypothetical protein SAMN03080617_03203 [Algoriphagus alkaliphilus]|uniref:4-amino-4-deoxy-L-arabinose transferase n=1 Tax=Algoriphagus alkaliphilus TaxID=279824 RepID=A0A1G5Z4P3_9BACT|nr:hypothetical protein [Algoriphagus alkaliphilus]SDA89694.1 hypothetical protein SAMN03080617_03203 [Algoriphagus alkaliphilus]
MPIRSFSYSNPKKSAFFAGTGFLFLYWLFGFDGITFSDDVYYLLAGKNFWAGTMEFNEYHFSTRWGAYIPSGLIGFLFGFDPHRISLISLFSYIGTLAMLLKVLPRESNPWVLLIWFSTQVYFLHFLTKVYPDSQLVFWTVLVPFSAVYRNERPILAALGLISGLFFGFLTKETIIFLAPLPVLLWAFDWKKGTKNIPFYSALFGFGIVFGSLYLAYFWIQFGSPFYRFESIQDGHYISEFTYADKSVWVMLKRLTILPILTFVERSYWIWIVFAIPGLLKIRKNPQSPGIEFGLAFLSLLGLFWVMSTNFRFYNPIYLNPRHLIILVPILAFLIALGWEDWSRNLKLKRSMTGLILLGTGISLIQQDWKMAAFQAFAIVIIYVIQKRQQVWSFGVYLAFPALMAISYQMKLKEYKHLIQTLDQESLTTTNQSIILTNNFLDFSKEVLLPENQTTKDLLFPIEKLDSLKPNPPQKLRVLIYDYYKHGYPKEQVDVSALEIWLNENYRLDSESVNGKLWLRNFSRE